MYTYSGVTVVHACDAGICIHVIMANEKGHTPCQHHVPSGQVATVGPALPWLMGILFFLPANQSEGWIIGACKTSQPIHHLKRPLSFLPTSLPFVSSPTEATTALM